ncbi:MAG: D-beta-D-heptose 1-phosphate adenosyltransferase [Firmicutes bacterium]|nr:D-beta-D-heptose 1-phosphate adenosyltransferase [Bacillota bacterium]
MDPYGDPGGQALSVPQGLVGPADEGALPDSASYDALVPTPMPRWLTYRDRQNLCVEEKKRIGERAAHLAKNGDTLLLDSGTTVFEVAKHLSRLRQVTVITNSLPVAEELSGKRNVTLILAGGSLDQASLSFKGPIAEQAIVESKVDMAFIGVAGISPDRGISTPDMLEVQVKRAMVSAAKRVVVVADHTKFGLLSLASIAPLSAVNLLVTGRELDSDRSRMIADRGARLISV